MLADMSMVLSLLVEKAGDGEDILIVTPVITEPWVSAALGARAVLLDADKSVYMSRSIRVLREGGVRVLCGRDVHAKLVVCESCAVVATGNLTLRALTRNFEVAVVISDPSDVRKLRGIVEERMRESWEC